MIPQLLPSPVDVCLAQDGLEAVVELEEGHVLGGEGKQCAPVCRSFPRSHQPGHVPAPSPLTAKLPGCPPASLLQRERPQADTAPSAHALLIKYKNNKVEILTDSP